MSFLYPITSNLTASLNSGSYLNKTDYTLFYSGSQSDFWFSTSNKDTVELSVYDLDENLVFWESINSLGEYKESTLTYFDNKNLPVSYDYRIFSFDYPIYKTEKILVNPIANLSSSNLPNGNYILSYQLKRNMAGSPIEPLLVKEISPNKTEVKMIPSGNSTDAYEDFCLGKISLEDVSPLYLRLLNNCPYSAIYTESKNDNEPQINLVKTLFFIPDDGKFVEFLKSIYEDFIKYSSQSNNVVSDFIRIQGVKTYFNNFLVSNCTNPYSFDDIKEKFSGFLNQRLDILFINFKHAQYLPAREYLFKLFLGFFMEIHNLLEFKYKEKFQYPLKNALCFDNGKFIPILNTSYIDERVNQSDPLTLLIKLQSPIHDDLSIKSSAWVANIGMIPILFDCIIKNDGSEKTFRISNPDFTATQENVSFAKNNVFYTSDDLKSTSNDSNINISKKINELNVDYTSLSNFIIFSSAELRHNILKNKMISISTIDNSIYSLQSSYSSSGYTYPYYSSENESLQTQKSEVLNSFDGFESYLYKTGYYDYSVVAKTFNSSSFVEYMDEETKRYDKFNRDSLINNTPEHIISDSENDEYLIFLSMVGHYFDNLYLYIKSLPVEKSSGSTTSFAKNILQQMLESFGWKLDASIETLNISNNYLDKSLGGTNDISEDNKTRQIWIRILNTLPLIYKTKGTEECIRIVLSCYGIPSTLIDIREYGGVDYSNSDKTSYTIEEKLFMLTFKGYGEYISIPFDPILKTIEFKVSLSDKKEWTPFVKIPLAVKYNQSNQVDWTIGVYKETAPNLGRAYFQFGQSDKIILTDEIPIFTGDIFNIMVRKNNADPLFEYNQIPDLIPTKYDLWVQRKDDVRTIYSSYKSEILTQTYNYQFSNEGVLYFGNYQSSGSFVGLLDKILLWDDPITDKTYDDHSNNINSYSFTGDTEPHKTLYFRMNFDYPVDFSETNPYTIVNSNTYYSSSIYALANNFRIIGYSSSIDNCTPTSRSYYPFQFKDIPYNQTFTITSYGPNKFKNQKVQKANVEIAARFDPNERSTFSPNKFISPDSNQIGLFADPNSFKNKDIFRYFGDYGVMTTLGDPSQMFDDKYYPLKTIRDLYNQSGNKKVLYNEMFTLYKFYFDKSIFETIKQLIPARNSIFTGILIEPTVLERPKYQYKRIVTEACDVEFSSSVSTSSYSFNPKTVSFTNGFHSSGKILGDVISADFRLDKDVLGSPSYENVPFFLPEGPYPPNDPLYKEFLDNKSKLIFVTDGWIKQYPPIGELGRIEIHEDWKIPTQDFNTSNKNPNINANLVVKSSFIKRGDFGILPGFYHTGSGYFYLKNCYFYPRTNNDPSKIIREFQRNIVGNLDLTNAKKPNIIYPSVVSNGIIKDIENPEELGIFADKNGKVVELVRTGSNPRYLLKRWNRDLIFNRLGAYSKPQTMQSQSVFLYTTQCWDESQYQKTVYTSSVDILVRLDIAKQQTPYIADFSPSSSVSINGWLFHHDINTFKQRPNSKVSNEYGKFYPDVGENGFFVPGFGVTEQTNSDYFFETFSGYPRNHLTHKRLFFSKESKFVETIGFYIKSRQNINTTVDEFGFNDNTLPVQTINVSNINVIKSDNVLNK